MAITVLTSPPPALTSAELAAISASTPSSFTGIPPLLRHKEGRVSVFIDPPFPGFSTGTNSADGGVKGELYVTEEALSFWVQTSSNMELNLNGGEVVHDRSQAGGTGIMIPYPNITLHAVSRSPLRPFSSIATSSDSNGVNAHVANGTGEAEQPSTGGAGGGGPCIYCQLDESEGIENGEYDEDAVTRELIIIPEDASSLDKIFETLSTCASLHPTPSTTSASHLFSQSQRPASSGYAGFGLDPDSMVYADENGNLAGPGTNGQGEVDFNSFDDAEEGLPEADDEADIVIPTMTAEEEQDLDSSAGRVRSDFSQATLKGTRKTPY